MTARAHDVGLGLAIAWARRRSPFRMPVLSAIVGEAVCIGGPSKLGGFRTDATRGPVVETEPLRDHRVAFAIVLAQRGPWVPVPRDPFLPPWCPSNAWINRQGTSYMESGTCVSLLHWREPVRTSLGVLSGGDYHCTELRIRP